MNLEYMQSRGRTELESVSAHKAHRVLMEIAEMIRLGKLTEAEMYFGRVVNARANVHTEREVAFYQADMSNENEFVAEAILLREAEAEVINEIRTGVAENAEQIVEGQRKYTRADIAAWLMKELLDIPTLLNERFTDVLDEFDKHQTAT